MSDQIDLSLRLSTILEMVGASEKLRQLHQRTAIFTDQLVAEAFFKRAGESWNINMCGSRYEGTVTPELASDADMIYCPDEPIVVPHRLMAGPGAFLHIVREDWTRPGYVKLQYMWDGEPLTVYNVEPNAQVGYDREGRACPKHWTYGNMHGPASMSVDQLGRHYLDKVQAYQCKGLPMFATDWITRHRPYDWPSQQQIDELKMMGCLFVGVGYFNSPEKDLEWRVSFSFQERRLMKSLNLTQHRVYILLKITKKCMFEKYFQGETLTSYHCKTCLFYMIETTPARMWVPENLINCLLECLRLLLQWVRNRFCPSFFLKDSNLFDKEGFARHMAPLERLLSKILRTGQNFLYLLESDRVGEMLRHGDLNVYRPLSDINVSQYVADLKYRFIVVLLTAYRTRVFDASDDLLSIFMNELEEYKNGVDVPGYREREARPALRLMLPWLNLSTGLEFAARAVTCHDRHEGRELMRKVDFHLQQAKNTDLVNVKLAQATILLRMNKLDECFLLLQQLESSLTWRVVFICPCKQSMSYTCIQGKHQLGELVSTWRDMPIRKLAQRHVASCVIFERSQIELVPPPLTYEMYRSIMTCPGSRQVFDEAWFDRAAVDANVYLYLLQYLVCSKLNKEPNTHIAIENLAVLTNNDRRYEGFHRDTAYNILGWVYLQEDRFQDAMRCFHRSWEIRPNHNAAKIHALNLLLRMAERYM